MFVTVLFDSLAIVCLYAGSSSILWYVSRKAIFGAGMGRDDGYYCGVLSSGVNLFLVEGSSFYSHPLVIYRPRFISCVMAIIILSNIHYAK